MSETWFTSDTHFGHGKIIEYCNRPFTNSDEMDRVLIANWNAAVQPEDVVYHNGDVALVRDRPGHWDRIAAQLHGTIHLTVGNHDEDEMLTHPRFASVEHYREIFIGAQRIVLSHYAMRTWHKCGSKSKKRRSLMFYGHSHAGLPGNAQSLDIGVDAWNFRPINLEQIRARLRTLPVFTGYALQAGGTDHHG